MKYKVYILLAEGYEEAEAVTPWDILKRAGAEVLIVSVNGNKYVTGAHGLVTGTDLKLDGIAYDFDMLFLPGGKTGTDNLAASEKVKSILLYAANLKKLIAAICAAPSVLGKYGLLQGKKAVCFPGFEDKLEGSVLTDKKVIRDGNIITAKGMGVAQEFGYLLAEALYGKDKADALKIQTQFS